MTGTLGSAGRWRSMRGRGAVAAATVVLAGIVPGADVALGDQQVSTELAYSCAFPGGAQPVKIEVGARFPDRAAAGAPIQPVEVTTSLALPDAAVTELTKIHAAKTGAIIRLTTEVAQNGATAGALWQGAAPSVPLGATGGVTLKATGEVPTVTANSPGDLTVTAAGLTIDFSPVTAEGARNRTRHPLGVLHAHPGRIGAARQSAGDRGHFLAPPRPPSTSATDPGDRRAATALPRRPEGRRPRRPRAPRPPPAPECRGDTTQPLALAAYVTGYSNVTKLGGASLIPVYCAQIVQGPSQLKRIEVRPGVFELHLLQSSVGRLDYQGRAQTPPAPATFLTFGFMPTTATMTLEETGPMSIDSDLNNTAGHGETYIRIPLVLRISDVKVNGTPLDVGPNCRTTGPFTPRS